MTTGNFADWNGNILDIGPIYPFVGWEVPMVIVGFIFWIGWQYLQIQMENGQLAEEASNLRQGDSLRKAVEAENVIERM